MATPARTAALGLAVAVLTTLPLAGAAHAEEPAAPASDCTSSAAAVETARAAVVDLRKKFTITKLHPAKIAKKLAADPTLLEGLVPEESDATGRGKPTPEERAERKQAQRDKVAQRKAALATAKAFKKSVKAEWEAAKAELRAARKAHEQCLTAEPTEPTGPTEPAPEAPTETPGTTTPDSGDSA